ncbi:MAG: hypothetical protein ACPGU7_09715 [Gammaproteobacteria bacterium]
MKKMIAAALVGMCFAGLAQAEQKMTGDQIKATFTDKTMDIHNLETGKHLPIYEAADGTHYVHIPWKNKTSKRQWSVEGDTWCTVHPKKGKTCREIYDMGHGTYNAKVDGEVVRIITNLRDGRDLP